MSENYQLVYQARRKCKIYRDTGVSKNAFKKERVVNTVMLNIYILYAVLGFFRTQYKLKLTSIIMFQ